MCKWRATKPTGLTGGVRRIINAGPGSHVETQRLIVMNARTGDKDHYLRFTLLLLGGLNLIDYYCTGLALRWGNAELNPLLAPLLSTPAFPLLKLGLVNLALWFVYRERQGCQRIRRLVHGLLQATSLAYLAVVLYHGWWLL